MPRQKSQYDPAEEAAFNKAYSSTEIDDFRQRQQQDYGQKLQHDNTVRRRQVFHKRFNKSGIDVVTSQADGDVHDSEEGEESWRTREGDRLGDYGVDEDIEFYDEEDLPLSELARRLNTESMQ
jgi:palmitoyltransferase